MKTKVQEEAGAIIAKALMHNMVYVPPTRFTIVAGYRCVACGMTEEHGPHCLPPFGLKKVEPAPEPAAAK